MREAEALAQTRHGARIHVDAVATAQLAHSGGPGSLAGEQGGELTEERLEAGRGDDLDDLARRVARVPQLRAGERSRS